MKILDFIKKLLMQNKFDVIITTYNREESLKILVENILEQTLLPENIIVVDSSSKENEEIQKIQKILYIKSSHGNQPYQRYLGKKVSKNEILIFMDDDMRILENSAFEKIINKYEDKNIIGVQPNFTNANEFLQEKLPKSKTKLKNQKLDKLKRIFTGYYIPDDGELSYCGIRGNKPKDKGTVEYFNGGVFSVKRNAIFTNIFNPLLFSLFEKRIGMGEDTILGFEASRFGNIIYLDNSMFLHDDQKDSTYSLDIYSYAKRTSYSRLFLSFEYVRLKDNSKLLAFLHFYWYMFWRVLNLFINMIISKKRKSKWDMLKGFLWGWYKATEDVFELANIDKSKYWKKEMKRDEKNYANK
ncbi:MAG: hypothetical protein CL623_11845 [Arcobacter sp.]|nr:hypothetical protein [Arcobacter sp.]|tara:strand:- start:9800 stop:10867 length:1068 start_codon:yes stop_codon:yes gene_type:complete